MPYVVSLTDYRPAPRSDGIPWTQARVEESATRTGTYTALQTFTFSPADSDPTDPEARSFTTEAATLPAGWYRVVFLDATGDQQPTEPVFAGSAIRPSVQEVADLMPDRTTVDGGTEARTFNTATTPTATEVGRLIDMVLDSVDPRVPAGATAEVERAARHVVTLKTAMLVESGNWGDQIETNEARLALWERLLADHNATLDAAADDNLAGNARFGSIAVTSPTLTAWSAMTGWPTSELLP